jgi:hypothetical protein
VFTSQTVPTCFADIAAYSCDLYLILLKLEARVSRNDCSLYTFRSSYAGVEEPLHLPHPLFFHGYANVSAAVFCHGVWEKKFVQTSYILCVAAYTVSNISLDFIITLIFGEE